MLIYSKFAEKKMGGVEITNGFRERLEQELSSLESTLKNINNRNKPEPKSESASQLFKKWYRKALGVRW